MINDVDVLDKNALTLPLVMSLDRRRKDSFNEP
jgi:hypothetical protein